MDYDVVIIGAGPSGLAAGIRLAHYDRKVCILERHSRTGGLNSYYAKGGFEFDVGLHAVTNYTGAAEKSRPLNRLLRQLRLRREQLELCEQGYSTVTFPGTELRFTNTFSDLVDEVARVFPDQVDGFRRLAELVDEHDALSLQARPASTRQTIAPYITHPLLQDMILCPLMYYGNACEHDMEFNQFCIMFQSIFVEGFCRPRHGVRQILGALRERYEECGGELRTGCGVRTVRTDNGSLRSLVLDDGTEVAAGAALSSAGYVETLRMCEPHLPEASTHAVGQLGFTESIFVLDSPPVEIGFEPSISFFNQADSFEYRSPRELVDVHSGVLCAPANFHIPADPAVPQLRVTHLANSAQWAALEGDAYVHAKDRILQSQREALESRLPGVSDHIIFTDMFTPNTVQRYTGHLNGAVYGSPDKVREGITPVRNLFICGTDQGFLGIVGAMLSGVSMANYHLLR